MASNVKTPYKTSTALVSAADIPSWLNSYDAERLSSYGLYENIYWTNPNTFKIVQRGAEGNPIYIPSGRVIVNTMDRYVGVGWNPKIDPQFGSPAEQAEAALALKMLLARERFGSRFQANKLSGVMKGDWCFYLTANANKPQGSRLSLTVLDPSLYFPIEDPNDSEHILGCDIVEQIVVGSDTRIKRIRYLKSEHPEHPSGGEMPGGPISYQVDALKVEEWETKPVAVPYDGQVAPTLLDPKITALPVYHIKNSEEVSNPFGSSEMRGIERLFAAVNQSITDEELALALHGLGMYKSEKGQPVDPVTKQPVPWRLGPGKVVHDETFERVNGVNSVTPFQDHLDYLHNRMDEIVGISAVSKGAADVSVAESGIALAFHMGPILSSAGKKDTSIKEVMDNLLYDLRAWIQVYEGVNMENVYMESAFGQKLPINVKQNFDQLMQMYTADPPLITAAYFRDACREMGIDIPIEVNGAAIAEERAQMAQAMDPYGERVNQEIANQDAAAAAAGGTDAADAGA